MIGKLLEGLDPNEIVSLEVQPVRDTLKADDGSTWCEVCEPEEAEFWTVYARLMSGEALAVEDRPTEAQANACMEELKQKILHLKTNALAECLKEQDIRAMIEAAEEEGACYEELFDIEQTLDEQGIEGLLKSNRAPYWAYWYANHVLHEPWPEMEPLILRDPYLALDYLFDVRRKPWPEAEPIFKRNTTLWDAYERFLARLERSEADEQETSAA